MNMNSWIEKDMRPADAKRAHELFIRIEEVLSDCRQRGEEHRGALTAVRQMMHYEFRDLRVITSFAIEDPLGFMAWRVDVMCPDGRPIEIVHDTFEGIPLDLAPLKKKFAGYPNILQFIDFNARHKGRPVLERLANLGPFELEQLGMSLEELDQSMSVMFKRSAAPEAVLA